MASPIVAPSSVGSAPPPSGSTPTSLRGLRSSARPSLLVVASKAARFFGPNEEEHERFLAPRRVFALPAERVVLRARFQRPA